jgi:hypothetical protein
MQRTKKNIEAKDIQYNHFQEPIILSKGLIDRLKGYDKFSDLLALYVFYYYTAKWQQTNRPKATTGYVAKGLHWSEIRVRKIKQLLIDAKLIKDTTSRDENNQIIGHYIYVRFIWSNEKIVPEPPLKKPPVWLNPDCGSTQTVENFRGNALSKNKEYIKKIYKKNISHQWDSSKEFIHWWDEWKTYKKEQFNFQYKSPKSELMAINKLIGLSKSNEKEAICIVKQSIENGWAGLFELKTSKSFSQTKPRNGYKSLEARKTYTTDRII